MTNTVKIIECPRDAWQSLRSEIPAEIKADYLRMLVNAGFKHLDAVSFVSPGAVPQMSDSERVLQFLDPPDDVEIIGIVVNEKGAERAARTDAVQTLGFPYSISPEFLRRNQKQSPAEALEMLEKVGTIAYKKGLDLVAYLSMAFGNPYGEGWEEEEVIAACDLLADMGIQQISLADTVGAATAEQISSLVGRVSEEVDGIEIGVHLHALEGHARESVAAAYLAGCRRFDTSLGGLGGCPFAQDTLIGNVATEAALAELERLGAQLPSLRPLEGLLAISAGIAGKFGPSVHSEPLPQ